MVGAAGQRRQAVGHYRGWGGGTVGYLTATTTELYQGDRSAVAIAPAAEIDSGCLLMSLLTFLASPSLVSPHPAGDPSAALAAAQVPPRSTPSLAVAGKRRRAKP